MKYLTKYFLCVWARYYCWTSPNVYHLHLNTFPQKVLGQILHEQTSCTLETVCFSWAFAPFLTFNAFTPVSYTHLDVYKRQHIPHNATLASFDIKNLYTNIPISETITILQNKLKQNNTPNELINEITETLNIITKQNYFTYNNKYYTQNDERWPTHGLPHIQHSSSCLLYTSRCV